MHAPERAAPWYAVVARTDPSYTTAAFGLARCREATGDRAGALEAYAAVPASSSAYDDAQVARIERLADPGDGQVASLDDLRTGAATLESLSLDPERRAGLTIKLLGAARTLVDDGGAGISPDDALLGVRLTEREVRAGIERGYRTLAHLTEDAGERVRLVDRANEVRPRTWT